MNEGRTRRHGAASGQLACYSLAWPKAACGRLNRGSLSISLVADGGLNVRYEEHVAGGTLAYLWRVRRTSRTLSMMIEDAENDHPLFLSFQLPLPPGAVLTDLLAGSAYHDLEACPSAARMPCVRSLQPGEAVARGNRYLDCCAETINRELEGLGYDLGVQRGIGTKCRDFLNRLGAEDRIEVPLQEGEALVMAFARLQMP